MNFEIGDKVAAFNGWVWENATITGTKGHDYFITFDNDDTNTKYFCGEFEISRKGV